MHYRPVIAALPWILVLLGSPVFLSVAHTMDLPLPESVLPALYVVSLGAILFGVGLGLVFTVVGLINRVRPIVIHGIAATALGVALMLYANSVPPRRYFAIDSDLGGQLQVQPDDLREPIGSSGDPDR